MYSETRLEYRILFALYKRIFPVGILSAPDSIILDWLVRAFNTGWNSKRWVIQSLGGLQCTLNSVGFVGKVKGYCKKDPF